MMKEIQKEMSTQSNRGNSFPIFVVVEDQKIYGAGYGWADGEERKSDEDLDISLLCDKCQAKRQNGSIPEDCDECDDECFVPYQIQKDVPNMRAAFFFTAKACDEHIEANRHHYNDTAHSYAISAYHNPELQEVIKHIQSL